MWHFTIIMANSEVPLTLCHQRSILQHMAKKRKKHQESPNQLMLFSAEEMAGESVAMKEDEACDDATDKEVAQPTSNVQEEEEERKENRKEEEKPIETPISPKTIEPSSDTVLMLIQVIRLLDGLSGNQVRLLAMQSVALLQAGIDPLETYRLPVLPGMEFRGDTLTGIAYVSIVRSFPHMTESIGVDLSSAYHKAMSSLAGDII